MPIAKIELRTRAGSGQRSGVLFETLELFVDPEPRLAALNMAIDEALLGRSGTPILRVYQWERPAVSFGYFEKWATVDAAYPAWERVRRWTGGGVVPHGADWTYSLIVPRIVPFAGVNAAESYRVLHEVLAGALGRVKGDEVTLTPVAAAKVSQACFENPAQHDLLKAGQKIAGAAQRRSRFGLLHQGSVQGVALPADFAQVLAASLAGRVQPRGLLAEELEAAKALAAAKYATEDWNRRY